MEEFVFDLDEELKNEEVNLDVLQINTHINLDDLHHEWQAQAFLMEQAGEELAKLNFIRRRLRAKFFKHVRTSELNISEAKLQNLLKTNDDYIKVQYLIAKLDSLVYSLLSRRKGLEKLVDLWLNEYWASPKEPRGDFRKNVKETDEKELKRREALIEEALNNE